MTGDERDRHVLRWLLDQRARRLVVLTSADAPNHDETQPAFRWRINGTPVTAWQAHVITTATPEEWQAAANLLRNLSQLCREMAARYPQ